MFTLRDVFFAFIWIALLILAGRYFKQKSRWLQRLFLPESIVAGVLALMLGPQVLGAIVTSIAGEDALLASGVFTEPIRTAWSQAPGIFINIVFAALFLGERIPNPRAIWRKAAPQVVFGQTLAWGQYVIGILITVTVLIPLFDANPISAALIEIGFEGGHGTAGGMAETFGELDFPEGADLALGLATVGIISGIIVGTALANWGRSQGHIQSDTGPVEDLDGVPEFSHTETRDVQERRSQLMRGLLIDPLSINFGIVGIAIVVGWLILQGLIWFESVTWSATGLEVMTYIPCFRWLWWAVS